MNLNKWKLILNLKFVLWDKILVVENSILHEENYIIYGGPHYIGHFE